MRIISKTSLAVNKYSMKRQKGHLQRRCKKLMKSRVAEGGGMNSMNAST